MLNFLGITRHLSTTAGYAKRIGWLLHEDVTQSPFPVTGVSFTGTVKTEQGDLPIAVTYGEQENYLELTVRCKQAFGMNDQFGMGKRAGMTR